MTAPVWMEDIVGAFGKAAGIPGFTLGERGVAALTFENGFTLRFEYAAGKLVVEMSVPSRLDSAKAKALLAYSHPKAAGGLHVRTGYLRRRGAAVFAVLLGERDATLPVVNQAFSALWRIAQEFGGAS